MPYGGEKVKGVNIAQFTGYPIEKIKILEVFDNQYPDRDYNIIHTAPEFTSLFPKTGQADFATIVIEYIPFT